MEIPRHYATQYLGVTVTVHVDRALGSKHPKYDWTYPVNYGELPGTIAPDGDPVDAYILGVDAPVASFTGTCVAVIHRTDDSDDKLVVVPEGTDVTNAEIRDATHFQEQYFASEIVRPRTGQIQAILFRGGADAREILMLKRSPVRGGFWQSVTGGINVGETPLEAVVREISEELNRTVDPATIIDLDYMFSFVTDFGLTLAERVYAVPVEDTFTPTLSHEHTEFRWVPFPEAREMLKWDSNKKSFDAFAAKEGSFD